MAAPAEDHVLVGLDISNLIITPQTTWASIESRQRLLDGIVQTSEAASLAIYSIRSTSALCP
ncbi:MAG: hypothetical protein ABGY95_00415 [Rubritalea sp.]|uniref:hypothetical protein n=1 Tax=Rubritalea sp. TaxID=2109375 RepID=UPI0032422BE9